MATASPASDFRTDSRADARAAAHAIAGTRDPRLDFFRGIAMFIILVAHIPDNVWANWIPARFGFSDATEIFVFCSGMASAIAFGGTFARKGFGIGTTRVAYRVWQVYWAHLGLFFFVAMSMAALDSTGAFEKNYVDMLNLRFFFDDPQSQLVGAFTLTYVPNYFDILPMYMVVLAMMPLVMAAARLSLWAVAGLCLAVWIGAQVQVLWLPAEPWSDREWFFNPFGWQLLFFTGFALMIGWLPAPPVSRTLVWIALAYVVLTAPIGSWKVYQWVSAPFPALGEGIQAIWDWFFLVEGDLGVNIRDKTDFGLLRYLHFLSLAYLAWVAVGRDGWVLRHVASGQAGRVAEAVLAMITKVGQQSLVIFVFSMALARLLGVALDVIGRNVLTFAAINLIGFALIVGVAYGAGWVKSQPWKSRRA